MSSKNVPPASEFRISFFIPQRFAALLFPVVRFATGRFQWPPNVFGFRVIIFAFVADDLSGFRSKSLFALSFLLGSKPFSVDPN
jgi:hypothetical protein